MKKLIALTFAIVLGFTGFASTANAVGVSIAVGDRPYYSHGPYYYVGPSRYVWVPGYWGWNHHHRHWTHGYYTVHRYR
jgi:hypothetical protein